jgi:hypothetical protein
MKTRAHRTPRSIWIATGLWLLIAAGQIAAVIWMLTVLAPFGAQKYAFGRNALCAAFAIYQAAALSQLSRWPVVAQLVAPIAGFLVLVVAGGREPQPVSALGLLLEWAPFGLSLALILPHWRKMSWGPFGRPYRPPEDQVEVFT